jgi:hypothetical protein
LLKSFPWSAGDYSDAIIDAQYANVETVKCKRQIGANFSLHHASCVRNRNVFRALRAQRRSIVATNAAYALASSVPDCCRYCQEPSNRCFATRMAAGANMHSRAVYA